MTANFFNVFKIVIGFTTAIKCTYNIYLDALENVAYV